MPIVTSSSSSRRHGSVSPTRRPRSRRVLLALAVAVVALLGVACEQLDPDNRAAGVPLVTNGALPLSYLASTGKGCVVYDEALASLNAMVAQAAKDGVKLRPASCYRDYAGQVAARDDWCSRGACQMAAVPGTSNHGWGKAIDFADQTGELDWDTPGYTWLKTWASNYGWIHPAVMEPDGSVPEPWHWEWIGDGGKMFLGKYFGIGNAPLAKPRGQPIGNLEVVSPMPGAVSISGWAIDPDQVASIPVHLYVDDASMGVVANVPRADVGAVFPLYAKAPHGFVAVLGASPGRHKVCAYAINVAGTGFNQSIGCRWVDVPAPASSTVASVAARSVAPPPVTASPPAPAPAPAPSPTDDVPPAPPPRRAPRRRPAPRSLKGHLPRPDEVKMNPNMTAEVDGDHPVFDLDPEQPETPRRGRLWWKILIGLGIVIVLLVGAAAVWFFVGRDEARQLSDDQALENLRAGGGATSSDTAGRPAVGVYRATATGTESVGVPGLDEGLGPERPGHRHPRRRRLLHLPGRLQQPLLAELDLVPDRRRDLRRHRDGQPHRSHPAGCDRREPRHLHLQRRQSRSCGPTRPSVTSGRRLHGCGRRRRGCHRGRRHRRGARPLDRRRRRRRASTSSTSARRKPFATPRTALRSTSGGSTPSTGLPVRIEFEIAMRRASRDYKVIGSLELTDAHPRHLTLGSATRTGDARVHGGQSRKVNSGEPGGTRSIVSGLSSIRVSSPAEVGRHLELDPDQRGARLAVVLLHVLEQHDVVAGAEHVVEEVTQRARAPGGT